MEHHELVINIAPDGMVQIEVQGITGSKCMDITKELETDIGKVLTREKKPEYYSVTDAKKNLNQIKTERS
jgi:hypothetical protein